MRHLVLVLPLLLVISACTDGKTTKRLLKAQGYDSVEIKGYSWLGCSEDDFYHTKFEAKKDGNTVRGVACRGFWFKNTTIRWD